MSRSPNSENLISAIFAGVLGLTVAVYVLRGFGILTFLPGGVIWMLILLSIATGILFGIEKTKRY